MDDFVDKAADLGYDGVLLMAKRPHVSLLDYGSAERARLRSRIAGRGLRGCYLAGYNNFTADLEHKGIPNLEIQVQYVTELARLAHDLGGTFVRIFTAYENPAGSFPTQWDLVVRGVKECARRAADFGVSIGVQNHHDIAVGFESHYDLIRAVDEPNCHAFFDAWAPALNGANLGEAAKTMAPITAHTTIANYKVRPRYRYDEALVNYTEQTPTLQAVPVDEGFIDYRTFLSALAEEGCKPSVAYEICSPVLGGGGMENLDRYARRFLEFLGTARLPAQRNEGAQPAIA